MSGQAQIQFEHPPGVNIVRITGTIDERFPGNELVSTLASRLEPCIIDLDGVTRITSFGVREWVNALKQLATENSFLICCRPATVAQINTVASFAGRARVVSFYCPYVCPECDHTFDWLVDVRRETQLSPHQPAPSKPCPKCEADAEFDDVEQSYFARVLDKALKVPPAVDALLDRGRIGQRAGITLTKEVVGDVTAIWLTGTLDKSARLKRHAEGLEGHVVFVLPELMQANAEGAQRLRDVLVDLDSAKVSLARMRVPVALEMANGGFGKAAVTSLLHSVTCKSCGKTFDADVTHLPPSVTCIGCSKAVAIDFDGATVATLAALPRGVTSALVKSYLETHPTRPADVSTPTQTEAGKTPTGMLMLSPGTKLGKYEILSRIGMGGMADVLLGRQMGLEGFTKKIVIKRILPHLAVQPTFVQQFLDEARLAARLQHPHVVQILDLGRESDDYFIVMEYIDGPDFNVLVRTCDRLDEHVPLDVAASIVADLCAGLNGAHSNLNEKGEKSPIIHRDISPHNVLVGKDGSVKITDFGVAKANDSVNQTEAGLVKGKVVYMAPEVVAGKPVTPQVDVFAAGVTLYVALTRINPFARETEMASVMAVLEGKAPPPSKHRPIPPELDAIVMRAIAKDPADRYATAEALQAALEEYLASFKLPSRTKRVAQWVNDVMERGGKLRDPVPPTPTRVGDLDPTVVFQKRSDEGTG